MADYDDSGLVFGKDDGKEREPLCCTYQIIKILVVGALVSYLSMTGLVLLAGKVFKK